MREPSDNTQDLPEEAPGMPGPTPRPALTPPACSGVGNAPQRGDFTHTVSPERRCGAPPRALLAGQVLAGRFRVLRFLGAGGMGEVYEAEDAVLRERVALKTLRADAKEARSAQDFMREIHLARKVTHANVCRIFDVFHHREPGAAQELAFLSMELLAGETLARRLARERRLTSAESLPLLRQMAAALDAAHARGVVHRDFKSGNVMLVPESGAALHTRAVVTDFGLAQGQAGDDSFASFGSGVRIAGTPAYMAPEQVRGERVGPAADVYALGVVAYEMLAGRQPFVGDTPLATAALRLGSPPPPPRQFASDLDPVWERAILRCLARDPKARFQHAGDFLRALESGQRPPRWRSHRAWALAALGLALLAGAFVRERRAPQPQAPASANVATHVARRSVAVLGFRNLGARPERAWLSTALAEMLSSELALGARLRLVPGERVAHALLELRLGQSETLELVGLRAVRQRLAADLVVVGSYFAAGRSGGALRLDLRVLDSQSGEALETLVENGSEDELPALVTRCGQRLRELLAAGQPGAGERSAAGAPFARNPRATRAYAEGLVLLRRHDAARARLRLLEATAAEPQHALAYAALGEAWQMLGYQERAREAGRRALELSTHLAREERLSIEARAQKQAFDWAAAAASYRTLWDFFPDNLEYGLELAGAEAQAGHGQEALRVVAVLRSRDGERDDPRIDLAEARAASALSDSKRAARAAGEAARKSLAAGARSLAAEARLQQAWAAFQLGDAAGVGVHAVEARRLFEEAGDKNGAADALQLEAHVLWMQQGRFAEAQRLYQDALLAYRATGNQRGVVQALVNGAGPRAEQGDFEGARRLCEESLPVLREIGDKPGEQSTLVNLSRLLLELGQLEQAEQRQLQALELALSTGTRSEEAAALEGLGTTLMLRGDLEASRQRHEQALAIRTALSEKLNAATSRADLARVLVEQGRFDQAATAVGAVADEMRAADQAGLEASALVTLTRALIGEGRVDQASATAARAEKLAPALGPVARLSVELVAAQVGALGGGRGQGVARLRAVRAQARRMRQVTLELQAWRVLVDLGEEPAAQLEREAHTRGFGLYARADRR